MLNLRMVGRITLVLILGGLAAHALTACAVSPTRNQASTEGAAVEGSRSDVSTPTPESLGEPPQSQGETPTPRSGDGGSMATQVITIEEPVAVPALGSGSPPVMPPPQNASPTLTAEQAESDARAEVPVWEQEASSVTEFLGTWQGTLVWILRYDDLCLDGTRPLGSAESTPDDTCDATTGWVAVGAEKAVEHETYPGF